MGQYRTLQPVSIVMNLQILGRSHSFTYFHIFSHIFTMVCSLRFFFTNSTRALFTRLRVLLSMAAALVHPGQPWHLGERTLQLQQKTVASSDEMGPRIYHKVRSKWCKVNWKCEKSEGTTWPVAFYGTFFHENL